MERFRFYIHIDEAKHCVMMSGLEFAIFVDGIQKKPQNMLLLRNDFAEAKYDPRLRMDYADASNIERLYADRVYDYGDFHWVDYQGDACRGQLHGQELAELLFADQFSRLMGSPFFPSLQNEYLYFTHDDGHYVKAYMRNIGDVRNVLGHKLEAAFRGRKQAIATVPDAVMDALYEACHQGVLFDLLTAKTEKRCTYVRYYVKNVNDEIWYIEDQLKALRKADHAPGGFLIYDARRMQWTHQPLSDGVDSPVREGSTNA